MNELKKKLDDKHNAWFKPKTRYLEWIEKVTSRWKIEWRLVVCLFVLFREEEKDKEMSCYYCKLRGADTVNVDINVGQGDFNDSREPRAHVLCFLTPHSNMLDQYPWNLTSVTCNMGFHKPILNNNSLIWYSLQCIMICRFICKQYWFNS